MKINLPYEVSFIINELGKSNFDAFAVGGCVRDKILEREPNDWDITTNALPENIIKIFDHTVPTGLKHGTITVIIDNKHFEVTTYRIDGEYSDNRHPDEVVFTDNLKEDLSRRDFTINSMAYNDTVGLVDPFNGTEDLKNNLVRSVRNAHDRFNEDALRMIRAIRFSCQLGFNIEDSTFEAVKQNCHLIKNVSIERIRDEFTKILLSKHPAQGIENLRLSNLLQYILPEIMPMVGLDQKNPHHDKDVYTHTLSVIENTKPELTLRLSALLHDIGKPSTFTIDAKGVGHFYGHETKGVEITEYLLKRLRFDNNTIKTVARLVENHMTRYENMKNKTIKKLINKVGEANLQELFDLQVADIKSSAPPYDFSGIDVLSKRAKEIIDQKQPLSLKDLAITGDDLIELGIKPGKDIGIILNHLLDKVLEKPELNSKEQLKKIAIRFIN